MLDVVNVGRVLRHSRRTVNTRFRISFQPDLHLIKPYSENPKTKIPFSFQWLASVPAAVWRRALKRWPGYRGDPFGCKPPKATKARFSDLPGVPPVENSTGPPEITGISRCDDEYGIFRPYFNGVRPMAEIDDPPRR